MNTILPWNALLTKPHSEEKACRLLKRRGATYYYPVNRVLSEKFTKPQFTIKPLLPSLIFVKLPVNMQLESLIKFSSIRSLIYWKDQPAVFPDLEIEMLRSFLKENESVEVKKNVLTGFQRAIFQSNFNPSGFSQTQTLSLPHVGYSFLAKSEFAIRAKTRKKSTSWHKVEESLVLLLDLKIRTNNKIFKPTNTSH